MKYLIVGLGNPGAEYAGTRHNVGFRVLDHLSELFEVEFSAERLGDVAEFRHKGRTLVLLKPGTFMNLSGKAVRYWLEKEKVPIDRALVITDDLALELGKIRLRAGGGDGGHNGLASISETLERQDYARLRFGIGSDFPRGRQSEYVLGKWTDAEEKVLAERVNVAGKAVIQFVLLGIAAAMNHFNTR